MNTVQLLSLFNEAIKEYEKSETFCIWFYSTDKARDFKILNDKVANFKKRLNMILKSQDGVSNNTTQTGTSAGEENLQR